MRYTFFECFFIISYSQKNMPSTSRIVNLGLSSSQFCSLTLNVPPPHFDYFALQDTQNDTPKDR